MTDHLVITGVKPYDGRYPWDLTAMNYTVREWTWLQQYANVYPVDYFERLRQGDAALMMVLTIVMMTRAGKVTAAEVPDLWDRFQDVDYGSQLQVEVGVRDEGDDADGPPPESFALNGSFSGHDGSTSSESSTVTPPASGSRASATSGSAPATSAT